MDKLEQRLKNEGSSEQGREAESVKRSPISQRNLSFDQYQDILEGADSLQRLAAEKGKRKEEITSFLPHDKEVPLSRVYEFAKHLGIDEKYVNEYLELRFPSEEQKLQDVRKFNAGCSEKLDREDKVQKCRSDITSLLETLKKTFPQEDFKIKKKSMLRRIIDGRRGISASQEEYVFYREDKKIVTTKFLKRKKLKKIKSNIASVIYETNDSIPEINFDLYDPSFLRACDNELEEIKKGRQLFFTYHYKIKS